MYRFYFFIFWALVSFDTFGQTDAVNYDFDYVPTVHSIEIKRVGAVVDFPILYLKDKSVLVINFDILKDDFENFKYKIIQCNKDWTISQLTDLEYLDGFNDQEIRNFTQSINTRQNYITYSFTFPNSFVSINKSGNYLLHVYNDDTDEMIFTRRFVVSEETFLDFGEIKPDLYADRRQSNQRIEISVSPNKQYIADPMTQVTTTILQGGRWNTAISLAPRFFTADRLNFDYPDRPSFLGLKNMRFFDVRTVRTKSPNIENIERYSNRTEVFLRTEEMRGRKLNVFYPTLFGYPIYENNDTQISEFSMDYFYVHFYLHADEPLDHDVYVLGYFNNWGNDEMEPMTYNADQKYYTTTIYLKQGFYEYYFAEKLNDGTYDMHTTEGSSYEASNFYYALTYYKALADRYDRLVGSALLSTDASKN